MRDDFIKSVTYIKSLRAKWMMICHSPHTKYYDGIFDDKTAEKDIGKSGFYLSSIHIHIIKRSLRKGVNGYDWHIAVPIRASSNTWRSHQPHMWQFDTHPEYYRKVDIYCIFLTAVPSLTWILVHGKAHSHKSWLTRSYCLRRPHKRRVERNRAAQCGNLIKIVELHTR